jgi:regulator of replication initiation timing
VAGNIVGFFTEGFHIMQRLFSGVHISGKT